MITDIIILAVIAIFAAIGVYRGIAKTLLNIAGLVLSAVLAYYLSDFLSQAVYDSFIKQSVITNIQQMTKQKGIEYAVNNCLEAVPQWINGIISLIIGFFGVSLKEFQSGLSFPLNFTTSAAQAIEGVVSPVVTSVLSIIFLIVLSIIIFLLLKKLIKIVSKVFDIPVIKQLNQLFGGILGIAEGLLVVFITVNAFVAITELSNPALLGNEQFSGAIFNFFSMH